MQLETPLITTFSLCSLSANAVVLSRLGFRRISPELRDGANVPDKARSARNFTPVHGCFRRGS